MKRVEVIKEFTLKDFDKLSNIERKSEERKTEGLLYVGDIFQCDDEMAKYLTGENDKNVIVVKILESLPEKVVAKEINEEKPLKVVGKPRVAKFKK